MYINSQCFAARWSASNSTPTSSSRRAHKQPILRAKRARSPDSRRALRPSAACRPAPRNLASLRTSLRSVATSRSRLRFVDTVRTRASLALARRSTQRLPSSNTTDPPDSANPAASSDGDDRGVAIRQQALASCGCRPHRALRPRRKSGGLRRLRRRDCVNCGGQKIAVLPGCRCPQAAPHNSPSASATTRRFDRLARRRSAQIRAAARA